MTEISTPTDVDKPGEKKLLSLAPPIALYSLRAIAGATFLGGPFGGGILMRRNYLELGKPQQARKAMVAGFTATLLLFGGLALLPDDVLDRMPNSLIPVLYTAAVGAVARAAQGVEVERHERNGGKLRSAWKALGAGLLSMAVALLTLAVVYAFKPESSQTRQVRAGWQTIAENEAKADQLSTLPPDSSDAEYLKVLDQTAIPAWRDNLKILDGLSRLEGLDEDAVKLNRAGREYANLKLQFLELLRKAIVEKSSAYDTQLEALRTKLQAVDLSP